MKLALITDLHANREALEEVLAHAEGQGAQRHAFLGDFVGYGADPGWVVDRVRDMVGQGALAVMGNHDAAVVQGAKPSMVPQAREVVTWTRERLSAEQLGFLQSLPMFVSERDCLFVHANAFAPSQWAYILGRNEAMSSMRATHCRYTFCGHVHEPRLYEMTPRSKMREVIPVSGRSMTLTTDRQWLALPGSTGQPRDGNPAASYAIFDIETATLTFHRVPYDHAVAAGKIRAAGLPRRLADRLSEGI